MFAVAAMKIWVEGRRRWPAGSISVELQSAHCQVGRSLVKRCVWKMCASVCENIDTSCVDRTARTPPPLPGTRVPSGMGLPQWQGLGGQWKVLWRKRMRCVLGNSLEAEFWLSQNWWQNLCLHHADIWLKLPEAFVNGSEIFKWKLIYMQTTLLILWIGKLNKCLITLVLKMVKIFDKFSFKLT